LNPIKDLTL